MQTPAQLARILFDAAKEMQAKCLFLQNEVDQALFDDCMRTLQAAALLDPVWDKPLVQQCVVLSMMTKRRPPAMAVAAEEALRRHESYDALAYLCRSWMENHTPLEAISLIQSLENRLSSDDLKNLCKIFYAICNYELEKYSEYTRLIAEFRQGLSQNFRPYIAIPAQTVRTSPTAPAERSFQVAQIKHQEIWRPAALESVECVVSASCDEKYLKKYAEFFFESFVLTQPNALCHLSVCSGALRVMETLKELHIWPSLKDRLIVAAWGFDEAPNIGPISASLRMYHAESLLAEFAAPVAIVDFDTVFKAKTADMLTKYDKADVVFRLLAKVAPWEMITGGIVIIRPTEAGRMFASQIGKFLEDTLTRDGVQWWVDQNALESAWRAMRELGVPLQQSDAASIRDQYLIQPTGKDDTKLAVLRAALDQVRGAVRVTA